MVDPWGIGRRGSRSRWSVGMSGGEEEGVVNHSISTPTRRALAEGKARSSIRPRAVRVVRERVDEGIGLGVHQPDGHPPDALRFFGQPKVAHR
jgi:hypothetical protein